MGFGREQSETKLICLSSHQLGCFASPKFPMTTTPSSQALTLANKLNLGKQAAASKAEAHEIINDAIEESADDVEISWMQMRTKLERNQKAQQFASNPECPTKK
jgi:hypothetical protein